MLNHASNNTGTDKNSATKPQYFICISHFTTVLASVSGQLLPTLGVEWTPDPNKRTATFSPWQFTPSPYTPRCYTHQTFVNLILKYVTRYRAWSQQKQKTKKECGRKVNANVSSKASGNHCWLGPLFYQFKEVLIYIIQQTQYSETWALKLKV